MTNKGKEAYRAYQKRKNEIKQTIKDHQNPSYRRVQRLIDSLTFTGPIPLTEFPDARSGHINTTIYLINNYR